MPEKKVTSSKNISNLDSQAKELGIGGNLSPENDEKLYIKKECNKEKMFN